MNTKDMVLIVIIVLSIAACIVLSFRPAAILALNFLLKLYQEGLRKCKEQEETLLNLRKIVYDQAQFLSKPHYAFVREAFDNMLVSDIETLGRLDALLDENHDIKARLEHIIENINNALKALEA